jgi:pimeloyl-ACP methyl ester carboxylesterase
MVDGQPLHYDSCGSGPPVVLVAGAGSRGRVWHLYQVPALMAAGYRVVTFDNRAGGHPGRHGVDSLVADTVALVESLELGPCRLVGFSLGARIVQELLLVRPDVADQAILLATRGRVDHWTRSVVLAERALHDAGTALPADYAAVVRAMQHLAPRTLRDDRAVRDWLELFQLTTDDGPPGLHDQLSVAELVADRLSAYSAIDVPCLVVGFAADVLTPTHLTREVATAIPGAEYREVADCGHFGYLEQPDAVNRLVLDFFARSRLGQGVSTNS